MAPWERLYIDALLRSRKDRIDAYETVEFVESVIGEPHSGAQELLLHRLIARLTTVSDAVVLIQLLQNTELDSYGPRVLARIADTEAVLRNHPELAEQFTELRYRTGYTTASINDWHLLTDNQLRYHDAPLWTVQSTLINNIVDESAIGTFGLNEVAEVLDYATSNGLDLFRIAVMSVSAENTRWAEALHKVFSAPYIEIEATERHIVDDFVSANPTPHWAPHWQLNMQPARTLHWVVQEVHTSQHLKGLGDLAFFDQVSVLLAATSLLRDGIQLSPIDQGLVQALIPSHPIWGFPRRAYAAARTTYQSNDIRALVLGFLEGLPGTERVSEFRSRLAFHTGRTTWNSRSTASILTTPNGFYQQFLQVAELFDRNSFADVVSTVRESEYQHEPVFQFLFAEANAALEAIDRLTNLPTITPEPTESVSDEILCVTHASLPEQTGGYAIRAHGILKSLVNNHVEVTAVTRPGFPDGVLTEESTVVVDNVSYQRLTATPVTRQHGEIQHMMSFVEPFRDFFYKKGIGSVHVRSTFLIAVPALLAARELGLKVLYEVSGLWELVYQDREDETNRLKKSPFAELAERLTMTHVDQLVVMNEAVRQIALDRGVDPSRIHVAHNAVDVKSFTPLTPPVNDILTLGYLGSFQDYEGLDNIIDVVKFLRDQEINIHVLMVGDGMRYNYVRSRIAQEQLVDQFTLIGRVPHSEVIDYYRQMDIVVYPRRSTGATQTITPLKPFEALALAKPIIVSDVAPLKEIVGDDERGLVFKNDNIADLARAIQSLRQNETLRFTLGQAGRNWVVDYRNWSNVVDTFMTSYESLKAR